MIRTLERLHTVRLGFNTNSLITFYVSLPESHYPRDSQVRNFFQECLGQIRSIPGVRSASALNALYVHWGRAIVVPVLIAWHPLSSGSRPPDTHVRIVDPEIYRVLQIPILRGRVFTAQDGPDARQAVVINETMARRYFGDEDPIGRRIAEGRSGPGGPVWQEIVGVVGDVRQSGLDSEVFPEIQVPYTQAASWQMAIVVRTSGNPNALVPAIRAQVQALDPDLPLTYMQTMDDVIDASVSNRRFGMRLLSVFASLALLLTAIGLYGALAFAVSRRTREIGIRVALGAARARLVGSIVREGLAVVLPGAAIGVLLATATSRVVSHLLYGSPGTDWLFYTAASSVVTFVGLGASLMPARRAAGVDPIVALRQE